MPTAPRAGTPAIVAVDGGNSKTDIALVGEDGRVLGVARTAAGSYHVVGMRRMLATIADGIRAAAIEGGLDPSTVRPRIGAYCLAGADLPVDDRRLVRALARAGFAERTIVRNDAFAGLRAGTSAGWGIALVCGTGMNCAGVGPTGRTVRFAALGTISGDDGGGGDLAVRAVAAGVRARDGRGPRTALETALPARFGLRRPIDLVTAVHTGRVSETDLAGLAPTVFRAAIDGDVVARRLVDWLADELVLLAASAIRRLHLVRVPVEVVLLGSVWRTDDAAFHERVRAGVVAVAPRAVLVRLDAPPVLGAALFGVDELGLGPTAEARLRAGLVDERLDAARVRSSARGDPSRASSG